jgi:hypothetical protein
VSHRLSTLELQDHEELQRAIEEKRAEEKEAQSMKQEITFKAFATIARRVGYTKKELARYISEWWDTGEGSSLPGAKESHSQFAERVFSPLYGEVVIPYQALLTLYHSWDDPYQELTMKVCSCGCGRGILGKGQYATNYCRLKVHRQAKQQRVSEVKLAA